MATIYAVQHFKQKEWNFDIFIETDVDISQLHNKIKVLTENDTLNRTFHYLDNNITIEEFYRYGTEI